MKKTICLLVALAVACSCTIMSFAHSGRTDSSGGHRDNKNKSGLGYYHYHCSGNPPHLHSGGVCPYSNNTTAAASSAASSSQASQSSKVTLTQAEKAVAAKGEEAITAARTASSSSATCTLTDTNELTLATMQEFARLAKDSGIPVKIHGDVKNEAKLILRLVIRPELASKTIQLGGHTDSEQAKAVKARYEKLYSNRIAVIALKQQGNFGMKVEIIAKVNLTGFDTENLLLYSYDKATDKAAVIPSESYSIDGNGFLHITTKLAGSIIITDKPWTDK